MIDCNFYNKIDTYIKSKLKDTRYFHSISVAYTAMNLANYYNENIYDALYAGLLHDIAKYYTEDELIDKCKEYNIELSNDDLQSKGVLHSYVGAYEAKKIFDINDNIFNAIYTHTLGDTNMNTLQKIIFISDFIEPLREFKENISKAIKYAYIDLDKCMLEQYRLTIEYLKSKNKYIHKKTLDVYNQLKEEYVK